MIKVIKKLYEILDKRERWLTVLVFSFMILVSFIETLGVASIMPFMAVLSNPDIVNTNQYLSAIYAYFEFDSSKSFLYFLGVVFLVVVVGSLLLKAVAFWTQAKFSHSRNHSWSCRLINNYIKQEYDWFLSKHSSALGASVLHEINKLVHGVLFPSMQLVSNILVVLFLMGLMILADPMIALISGSVLGFSYILLFISVRRHIQKIGVESRDANRERFKVAQEAFGGVKDVKVAGLENVYVEKYRKPSLEMNRRDIKIKLLGELPSFLMQAIILGGVMLMLLYLLSSRGGLQQALPIFSLFAFAGYRLMPALQQVYRNLSEIRYNIVVLDTLYSDLRFMYDSSEKESDINASNVKIEILKTINKHLNLNDVCYSYPGADNYSLQNINLKIDARTTVGLVGPTGSGKTTLVDLILGLLYPDKGNILIDDVELKSSTVNSWKKLLGYVPQQIYLSDDSIASNIAFGIPLELIDKSKVIEAAKAANLHEFVVNDLPDQYETLIGERGVRLSGGQRQRIGIARALYRNPEILILDEATSALDNLTEEAVMDAVHNLGNKKTIILIAHRLSTVQECDVIYYLDKGKITASGTYKELLNSTKDFRDMVGHKEG